LPRDLAADRRAVARLRPHRTARHVFV